VKSPCLSGILLVLALSVSAFASDELSLDPAVSSSAIRMDATPLTRGSDNLAFDLQPWGGDAQTRQNLAVPWEFLERTTLQFRQVLADGLTLVDSTGLGLGGTDSVWRSPAGGFHQEEESLLFHDTALKLAVTKEITVAISSRLARGVDSRDHVRSDWTNGAVLIVTPLKDTTLNAGVFRGEQLDTNFHSDVLAAGLDSKIANTPLTISLSGWSALGAGSGSDGAKFSSGGGMGSILWQCNEKLWLGAGLEREVNDGWGLSGESWGCYLSTVYQVSPAVTLRLELGQTNGSCDDSNAQTASAYKTTSLRVSRTQRHARDVVTAMSVEVAVNSQDTPSLAEAPMIKLAWQFSF